MANDEPRHVALPKLFGAPAYARPPVTPVARADRPFDPDELPLESDQTEEERLLLQQLTGHGSDGGPATDEPPAPPSATRGERPLKLPFIGGLLRGGSSATARPAQLPVEAAVSGAAAVVVGAGTGAPVLDDEARAAEADAGDTDAAGPDAREMHAAEPDAGDEAPDAAPAGEPGDTESEPEILG